MKVIFRNDRMQTREISAHNLSGRRPAIVHKLIAGGNVFIADTHNFFLSLLPLSYPTAHTP
jgi:hypothetical protein